MRPLLHLGQGQVSPVATDSCTDSSSVVICVAYTSIPFSECVGIHTARFYLGKGGFPHTRHFDIGNLLVLDNPINGKPLVGRYKFFFSRTMYWRANSVSIIAARVAGVPIPASFRLAFSSASSSSFPAFSIAASRLLSVCSGFRLGLLFKQIHAGEWQIFSLLERRQAGGFFITSRFLLAEHGTPPGNFHHRPFTVKSVSPADNMAVVMSFTHLPEKASSIRPATSS